MEVKVCLRENELEEPKRPHNGRDLELELVSASVEDLRKLMEISDTLIADKNKEIVSLRTCLKQRTGEIRKMKFNEEPTQEKLLLVSAELSRAQNEKAKLWSKVHENNTLHEKRIALKRQENVELKREIQRLRTELLKKEAVDMTKDAAVEVSPQPLMVSS